MKSKISQRQRQSKRRLQQRPRNSRRRIERRLAKRRWQGGGFEPGLKQKKTNPPIKNESAVSFD